jgi:hypothetical protein
MIANGGFASPPAAALELVDERPAQVSIQKPADKVAPLKTALDVRLCGGDSERVDAHELVLEVVVGGGDVTKKRRPPLRSGEAAGRSTRTPEDAPVGDELWVGRVPRTAGHGNVWRRVQSIEAVVRTKELSTGVVGNSDGLVDSIDVANIGTVADAEGVVDSPGIDGVDFACEVDEGVVDSLGTDGVDFQKTTVDGAACEKGVADVVGDSGGGDPQAVEVFSFGRRPGGFPGDYAVDGGAAEKRRRRLLVKWRKRWRPVAGRSERRIRRTPRTADTGDSDVLGSGIGDEVDFGEAAGGEDGELSLPGVPVQSIMDLDCDENELDLVLKSFFDSSGSEEAAGGDDVVDSEQVFEPDCLVEWVVRHPCPLQSPPGSPVLQSDVQIDDIGGGGRAVKVSWADISEESGVDVCEHDLVQDQPVVVLAGHSKGALRRARARATAARRAHDALTFVQQDEVKLALKNLEKLSLEQFRNGDTAAAEVAFGEMMRLHRDFFPLRPQKEPG